MYSNAEKTAQEAHRLTSFRDQLANKLHRHLSECAPCRCAVLDSDMCNDGLMLKGEFQTAHDRVLTAAAESAGGVA